MKWVTGEDVATTELAAAEFIAARLSEAIRTRGRASLAVSGGRTPWSMFARLAQQDVAWARVHLFQVDERIVAADSDERNWKQWLATPLAQRIPAAAQHPMPVEQGDPARRYEETLREFCGDPPALDVVHLGIGDDGHTASLFVGDRLIAETTHDVGISAPRFGLRRLTLTLPMLARARCIVWLVLGAARRGAVRQLHAEDRGIAASLVARDQATVFTDPAAAP
ncbi:MAG: 6-phosphogluconolactonase [Steroidobacteraceae bacterium]|nr:6-phosphogluconolactonase [Steroidobacteraceae bacterium]